MELHFGHVGIVVRDIDRAVAAFCGAFDLPAPPVRDDAEAGVRFTVVDLGGGQLEFLEDYGGRSPLAGVLDDGQRAVVHHFALKPADIDAAVADLKDRSVKMVDQTARTGLRGKRIAFVDPDLIGLPLELTE
jgi:methylmalonyl-CoA/ethylmalonyl-CoA epimerase